MALITGVLTEGPEGSPAFLLLPEPILGGGQAPRLPELLAWDGRAFGEQPSLLPLHPPGLHCVQLHLLGMMQLSCAESEQLQNLFKEDMGNKGRGWGQACGAPWHRQLMRNPGDPQQSRARPCSVGASGRLAHPLSIPAFQE